MSFMPRSPYQHHLEQDPSMVCVERGVLVCRSLLHYAGITPTPANLKPMLGADATDRDFNLSGALLGTAQGIRMHELMNYVELPGDDEIQIVDWNTENGFHTMALLEVFISRGITSRVTNVTLIHPSDIALERARSGVKHLTERCSIDTICRCFPARSGIYPSEIVYRAPLVIHILPDCMDMPGISPTILAGLIARPGHRHIVISVMPMRSDYDATERLISLMSGAEVIRAESIPALCRTPQGLPVSMRMTALTVSPAKSPRPRKKHEYTFCPAPRADADYALSARVSRLALPSPLADFCHDIYTHRSPADSIILAPALQPFSADMAYIRPSRGILLAKTIDLPPTHRSFTTQVDRAVLALRDMRRHLALHIPGLDGRGIVRSHIRLAVIATAATTDALPHYPLPGDTRLIAPDLLHSDGGTALYRGLIPMLGSNIFTPEQASAVADLLAPRWHWSAGTLRTRLNANNAPAASPHDFAWTAGAAGSGKTATLLAKAIAIARTHHTTPLVVLPCATALASTRLALKLVDADFSPSLIHIAALPDLLRATPVQAASPAVSFAIPAEQPIAAEPEASYTRSRPTGLYRFILIDDAHAISSIHYRALRAKWLHPSGRVIGFLNPLETTDPQLTGRIGFTLHGAERRFLAANTALISRIAHAIDPALPLTDHHGYNPDVTAVTLRPGNTEEIGRQIHGIICDIPAHQRRMLITAHQLSDLRNLYTYLNDNLGYDCVSTFTPPATADHYKATTRNPSGAITLTDDAMRHRFAIAHGQLGMAAASELQGVTADTAIYLYRPTARPDYRLIYRVITRATSRLIIATLPSQQTSATCYKSKD